MLFQFQNTVKHSQGIAEALTLTNNYPVEFDIEISCRNRPTR